MIRLIQLDDRLWANPDDILNVSIYDDYSIDWFVHIRFREENPRSDFRARFSSEEEAMKYASKIVDAANDNN